MCPSSSTAAALAAETGPEEDNVRPIAPVADPEVFANASLRGADLSGRDLSGQDLSGADLGGADLSGANLAGANLRGCSLFSANLAWADFMGADLRGVDLSESRGESASFGGADLREVVAFGARLDNVTFTRARLGGADFRAASLRRARILDADLAGTIFDGADLSEATLQNCECSATSFVGTDFSNGSLRRLQGAAQANWVGARTLGVDFTGAFILRRTVHDQNYLHEFRTTDRAHAVLHWVWWVTSDCGRSMGRWLGCVGAVVAVFGALFSTVNVDFGGHETWLSPYYFSVVTLTTLGYGDALPASAAAQALSMLEVVVGYMMLGGMLSIFANKMARRAD